MLTFIIMTVISLAADNEGRRITFTSLTDWTPLYFPKIKKHTHYSIISDGGKTVLRAGADNSASGLVYNKRFNVYRTPFLRWKWKISNTYVKGDEKKKSGDDYPIRIYIIFEYDPSRLGAAERFTYNAARLIYGKYPPDSSLNYIWANKTYPEKILTSPYTGKSKMVLVEKGDGKAGQWIMEKADILQDYREAFGTDPSEYGSIALMSDADNTGEKAEALLEFIEISETEK